MCKPYSVDKDYKSKESKSLNVRSVMGMRAIGRGLSGLESFCGMMNMLPPVSAPAFSLLNSDLADSVDC